MVGTLPKAVSRRLIITSAGSAAAAAGLGLPVILSPTPAHAAWPGDKPIKIIVPFAAGGPVDIMARVVAGHLSESMKASFFVENKGGAGGNIGMGEVARADHDGYTLLITSSAIVVNPSLYDNAPFSPGRDFDPISELGASPNVFLVTNDLGVTTMAELVALARKEPDKLNYASPGIGTTPHLGAEWLKSLAGIKMAHVSHNGAGPAVQSILAGTTQVASVALPPAHPHIQAGTLKALAVTGARRWPDLPSVPTMVEAGYPGFVADTMVGFLAPAKTPRAIIDAVVAATGEILRRPDVKLRLEQAGFDVISGGPAGMKARIDTEVPMWRNVIATAGIKVR